MMAFPLAFSAISANPTKKKWLEDLDNSEYEKLINKTVVQTRISTAILELAILTYICFRNAYVIIVLLRLDCYFS
jgi:hypothetical protein